MTDTEAYIGIGSNIEPELHIGQALAALEESHGPIHVSPWYRSAPVGFEGPDFINGVARITVRHQDIDALVEYLKARENRSGRRRLGGTGSRELDLDLLLFGRTVLRRGKLVLPRPDILKYAFVLRPLADLAPEGIHPDTGKTFAWHWTHFCGDATGLESITLAATATGPDAPKHR